MEIECSLKEFGPYEPSFTYDGERKKLGRYEGGMMPTAGFGNKKWSIAACIVMSKSIEELKESGLTENQVVDGCIKFLNKKPYRARKLPYGTLACRHFIFHADEISVSLMTDDRNNKNFWGRGSIKAGQPAKRGRPRKKK
tara:strand:+ start:37005 stop:37424 length:420 start_codon:yes stop_codon:yes gene_type:complete